MPADDTDVKKAFSRMGIAAAVITVRDGETVHGSTGMAWAEQPDPPLLLTTLRTPGTTMQMVELTGCFGVSVLAADQHSLVWKFARARAHERFEGVNVIAGPVLGLPLIAGSVARLECRVVDTHPFGAHSIVVGTVESAAVSPRKSAVVHFARRLWSLTALGEEH